MQSAIPSNRRRGVDPLAVRARSGQRLSRGGWGLLVSGGLLVRRRALGAWIYVGVFVATSVVIGLISTDALAANQLVLNVATITFMVPSGIAQAATVRCAIELGAARLSAARRAGLVAVALGTAFMTAAAIVLWTAPRALVGIYVDIDAPANQGMVAIAQQLMMIAAVFQVFDGAQTVAAGALRDKLAADHTGGSKHKHVHDGALILPAHGRPRPVARTAKPRAQRYQTCVNTRMMFSPSTAATSASE